jgi:parvulin-like peptidyl-prolyl isomerase
VVVTDLPPAVTRPRRGVVLLALGAAAGIAAAASGLVTRGRSPRLPDDAVAEVNGQPIATVDYERVLGALASDRREGSLGPEDRQRVLDRLVDETLLVQRGLELGLVWRDAKVRKDLTTAVIDAAVAAPAETEPSETELQAFYGQNRDFFVRPGRVRVRQVWCRAAAAGDDPAVLERAGRASARLRAGEDFAVVHAALGDEEVSPLPDTLLPPAKLLDYLGPTALRATLALEVGGVSDPVRSSSGYHVLQVTDRQGDAAPPLAQVRGEVVEEFHRRAGEQALRHYLDDLRRRADIAVRPGSP